jgi:hypothetical protein
MRKTTATVFYHIGRERDWKGGKFRDDYNPVGLFNNNMVQQQQQRPRGGKEKKNYHRIRINRYDKLLVVSTMSAVLLVPCSVITTVMDGEGAPLSPVRIFRYNKIIFFSFFSGRAFERKKVRDPD